MLLMKQTFLLGARRGVRNSLGWYKSYGTQSTTVDQTEVSKFSKLAEQWWDPNGPMAPLHSLNRCRVSYVRSLLCNHFSRDANDSTPLVGLSILDVGCGGGLLSESLARLGATVLGIDVSEQNIGVASAHQAFDGALCTLKYRVIAAGNSLCIQTLNVFKKI